MSIIYDALKKVEKSGGTNANNPNNLNKKPKPNLKGYLIYVLIAVGGFFIASTLFNYFTNIARDKTDVDKRPEAPAKIPSRIKQISKTILTQETPVTAEGITQPPALETTQTTPPLQPLPNLSLSGIFFSEDEGYAIINNRVVKVGDEVERATVKEITLEGVELEVNGSLIRLEN